MESDRSTYLFVYNTLRSGFHESAYKYIRNYFTFVDTGKTPGVLNDLYGEPFATPSDSFHIHGELYKLNNPADFSYVFGQLDDYEGLDAETEDIPLYKREIAKIYPDKGDVINSWLYWYTGDVHGFPVISSGDAIEYYGEEN